MNFNFVTVPHIEMRWGCTRALGELLRGHYPGVRRVSIITDGFLHQSGLLELPLADLAAHEFEVLVIDEVVADPPEQVVLDIVARARAWQAELVIGFGGGSSMDAAKLLAVLLDTEQPLPDMYGIGNIRHPRQIPLVQIPTTSGTGSEVTPISVVTTGESTKSGVVDPALYADIALLDAELTVNLPRAITAATGIDAMVHAVESYTSAKLKNPLSDMLAVQALRLLSTHILTACEDGSNRAAREGMLLGSMLAGQAFANAPVAAVHALAYPIGGHFKVAHGLSNALVLTHVMRENLSVAAPLYAELAEVVLPGVTGSDEEKSQALISFFEEVVDRSGIEKTLREVGIKEEHLELLTQDALLQTRLLQNNPRELNYEDVYNIYSAAL